jgi:hypothetical protein
MVLAQLVLAANCLKRGHQLKLVELEDHVFPGESSMILMWRMAYDSFENEFNKEHKPIYPKTIYSLIVIKL